MTPLQFLKRTAPQLLLTATLVVGGITVAGPAGAQVDDSYDTYDDDPGDPDFNFQTPFVDEDPDPLVDAEPEAEEDPEAVVAGENQPAAPQPVAQDPPVVAADVVTPAPAPAPAPAAEPAVLESLPRTGSGARQATLVGGLLLIAGGVASLIGRRRKMTEA